MGHPRPLFHLFLSFQTKLQILQQINVKKCPSSTRCWDFNPRPLEHESLPITTRPGLPPLIEVCTLGQFSSHVVLFYLSFLMLHFTCWPSTLIVWTRLPLGQSRLETVKTQLGRWEVFLILMDSAAYWVDRASFYLSAPWSTYLSGYYLLVYILN